MRCARVDVDAHVESRPPGLSAAARSILPMRERDDEEEERERDRHETTKATLRALLRNTDDVGADGPTPTRSPKAACGCSSGVEPKTMSPPFAMMSETPSVRMSCG